MANDLIGQPILDDEAIVGDWIGRYAPLREWMVGGRLPGDTSSHEGVTEREDRNPKPLTPSTFSWMNQRPVRCFAELRAAFFSRAAS